MAKLCHFVLGVLVLQMYVNAAPSDVSKIEDIVEVEPSGPKLDSEPTELKTDNSTQTRQKRWFNHYGYGFPPINPVIYPTYNKRDESINTGNYGYEDPFTQIHKRLQEIAAVVRQPPPPPPPHIPIFYPVIFIPTLNCGCEETATKKPETTTNQPDDTTPAVTSRLPDLEDERQIWGLVYNQTESDDDDDNIRPLSFEPIKPLRPLNRPPPSVEHGTVQSGGQNAIKTTTTTLKPLLTPTNEVDFSPPNPCDGAILSCCHQANVIYDCFAFQGCPDYTAYGNPCESKVILSVIEKFRKYYGQRTQ